VKSAQAESGGRFFLLDLSRDSSSASLYRIELPSLVNPNTETRDQDPASCSGSIVALGAFKAEAKVSAFAVGAGGICTLADGRDLVVCEADGCAPSWKRIPRTLPVDGLQVDGGEIIVTGPYFHVKRGRYALYFDAEDEDTVGAYVERFHRLADGSWVSYSFEDY